MERAKTLLTAEEFDNYPFEEDKRYELDEGELIVMTRPAYKHNRVLGILFLELGIYFRKNPIGEALISENLYALSKSIRRSPDVAVILGNRQDELQSAKVISVIPDIAVEVLSPSETTLSVHRKLRQYIEAGVKEVWLIDPEANEAEKWTGPEIPFEQLTGEDALRSTLLPGFELPLPKLFS